MNKIVFIMAEVSQETTTAEIKALFDGVAFEVFVASDQDKDTSNRQAIADAVRMRSN